MDFVPNNELTSVIFPTLLLQVQDYFLWCSQLISAMAVEESISDVATADLQLAQHQQLWAEMEARQETYQQALDMGEELQTQDKSNQKEVRRRSKILETLGIAIWHFSHFMEYKQKIKERKVCKTRKQIKKYSCKIQKITTSLYPSSTVQNTCVHERI